ncbi:ABC transporter ATP-binding protein, partial [Staphylococcus aureus]|nr:ABC transporter ATP-binding protein [Staphylococcus aureus]
DEGHAQIFDTSIPDRKILNEIGYMGQSDALYESLTARENLVFFGNLMGLDGDKLKQAINKNMKLVNLENELHQIVNTFSGG